MPDDDDGYDDGYDDERSGGGRPPEDDLPATGRHDIVPGEDDEREDDERENAGYLPPEEQIPSFEEYRRAREQQSGGEPATGGWSPFGGGAQRAGGDDPGAAEPSRESDAEAGEAAEDTLPVRGRGAAGEEEEEGGDTLDGGQALEGVELPPSEEGWVASSPFAGAEPADIEAELARQVGDPYPTDDEHTAEEIRARRVTAHRRHRRNGRIRLLILLAVVAVIVLFAVDQLGGNHGKSTPPPPGTAEPTSPGSGKSFLDVAKDTSVLPANLLIAEWGGRKLLVVSPTGQIVWSYTVNTLFQNQLNPDYAFFNATGDQIAVTEESHSQIELLKVKSTTVTYHYGHYDKPGSGVDYVHDPSAAIEYGDGQIVAADIDNCRLIELTPPNHTSHVRRIGHPNACTHNPPQSFASPASAFPLKGGGLVVSELKGGWVDLLSPTGTLTRAFKIPGFTSTTGANEDVQGDLVAVDHTHPGAVDILTMAGKVLWHYAPKLGPRELFRPSMAIVLPDGNVLVSDDYDDRVIVIDRKTQKIVWQYGHLHRPSGKRGYLDLPVGIDLVHPYSLLGRFTATTPPR